MTGIGVDIEKTDRFKGRTLDNDEHFLRSIFTDVELEYSFSKAKPAQHLCARYCAKEAVVKALSDFDVDNVSYKDIEVYNKENNAPAISIKNHSELDIKVSLSHTKDDAIAFVTVTKE